MASNTFFLFSLVCVDKVSCEPQCSPFSYHEQMLEKMVDVKYKMEIWRKFERWEKVIDEKLSRLDGTIEKQQLLNSELLNKYDSLENGILNRFDKLEKDLTDLVKENEITLMAMSESLNKNSEERLAEVDRSHQQMETQIMNIIAKQDADVNATMMQLANSVVKLENDFDENKKPVVLFKVRNVHDLSPPAGSTVVFQTIVQNKGNGYSTDTGIFTAPVNGTFLFTAQLCLYGNKALSIRIVANESVLTLANFGDPKWGRVCHSTDGFSEIFKGDKVRVEVAYSSPGNVIFSDTDNRQWSYFSVTFIALKNF